MGNGAGACQAPSHLESWREKMYDSACTECGKPIKFALIVMLCDPCLLKLSLKIKESKRVDAVVLPELPHESLIVCLEQVWTTTTVLTDCGKELPCPIHQRELRSA